MNKKIKNEKKLIKRLIKYDLKKSNYYNIYNLKKYSKNNYFIFFIVKSLL